MKKLLSISMAAVLSLSLLAGCGAKGTDKSNGTESSGSNASAKSEKAVTLKLAHNLNEQHPVHLALAEFAKIAKEKSGDKIKVEIYPNGQLGSESEVLEQLQAGAVAMTKVSATALTPYADGYNAFSLPYVFNDKQHFYKSMESDAVKNLYASTEPKGFVGLTYYDSGARSFYTVNKAITKPEDLKGLKIRVMGFQSQTDMMKALGGTAVGLPYGEVYTALQSGVIDGAESNETALTIGKHGEVAKYFSYDEHTIIPDILVISSAVWKTLSPDQQKIIKEAAAESTKFQLPIWDKSIEAAKKEASEKMNVKFNQVDKEAFRKASQPLLDKYAQQYPEVKKLLDAFKAIK